MKTTKAWKVYGAYGHRQRESFAASRTYEYLNDDNLCIVEVKNSDKTGTNEYSIIRITANSEDACVRELDAQIGDGIFENSVVGRIEEIF